jgi:hypothetical protein
MTQLSQKVSDYYYAIGNVSVAPESLKDQRVGGDGRWHIFHLPEGGHASLLQASAASAAAAASSSGDRRGSLSALKRLTHGMVLSSSFPAYVRSAAYKTPLATYVLVEKKAADSITPAGITSFLTNLTTLDANGYHTRSWEDPAATKGSTAFLQKEFSGMGLTNCLQGFSFGGKQLANVIAHIPGRTPDAVVVGAHYDSRPYEGNAPGAEDNGSGVAALLAIAKAFSAAKTNPTKNVYFVAFAAEEPGLKGSDFFASSLKARNLPNECKSHGSFLQAAVREGKHSAIVLDEVGWRSPKISEPTVNLESYDWTREVMDHMADASMTLNGQALKVVHSNNPFGSDHMSFLSRDMAGVLAINGDDEAYPHYHASSDTIENVDPKFVADISKMVLGASMRLSGV